MMETSDASEYRGSYCFTTIRGSASDRTISVVRKLGICSCKSSTTPSGTLLPFKPTKVIGDVAEPIWCVCTNHKGALCVVMRDKRLSWQKSSSRVLPSALVYFGSLNKPAESVGK